MGPPLIAAEDRALPFRQNLRALADHLPRWSRPETSDRPSKIKRDPHDQRYESVRPNHRWHLDFVHRHIHRASTFNLILLPSIATERR
jgi:hypothetical protein